MNRDKDEFWAITDPDGRLLAGTFLATRVEAISAVLYSRPMIWSVGLSKSDKGNWDKFYRQGYRARRVRVEVI